MKKYLPPLIMFTVFETIAIVLWHTLDNIFYFFNFTYIGGFIALGLTLYAKKYKYARQVVQLGVGLYMLIYLGLISNENMQIEGFWYYLFMGVFEAATIHYAIAKISVHFSLAEAGAVTPVGRRWYLTSYRLNNQNQTAKT